MGGGGWFAKIGDFWREKNQVGLQCTLSLIDTPAKTRGPAAPVVLATYIKVQHRQQHAINHLVQQCVSLITYPLSTLKQNVEKLIFVCLLSFSSWEFRGGLCLLRDTLYIDITDSIVIFVSLEKIQKL